MSGQLKPSCTPTTRYSSAAGAPCQPKPKRRVQPTDATGEVTLVYPVSEEEYRRGIAALKNGEAACIYDVLMCHNY